MILFMELFIQLIIIMIVLELMEASLQRAETLGNMIEKLFVYYDKSIFLFFMVHPTFYFTLSVSLYLNLVNVYIIIILLIKTLDIFFKIALIKECYFNQERDNELMKMLDLKMNSWMGFLGVFTYVPLLFMAIFA